MKQKTLTQQRLIKTLCIIGIGLLSGGCQQMNYKLLRHAPTWFVDRNIEATDGRVMGYGLGRGYAEASTHAMTDIAQQLQVNVKSTLTRTVSTGDTRLSSSHQAVSVSTDVVLNKMVELRKEVNGHGVYILYSYQESSLLDTIYSLLGDTSCDDLQTMMPSNYLQYTPVFEALKHRLGCLPALSFWFKNGQWYVQYQDKYAQITNEDIKQFYIAYQNPKVGLQLTDEVVENKGLYRVLLQAKNDGYMNLLQITAEGNSQLLLHNLPVSGNSRIHYPNLRNFQGLEAVGYRIN